MATDIMIIVCFIAIGVWIGQRLEAMRWRKNADEVQRIASWNGLYKVTRDCYFKGREPKEG